MIWVRSAIYKETKQPLCCIDHVIAIIGKLELGWLKIEKKSLVWTRSAHYITSKNYSWSNCLELPLSCGDVESSFWKLHEIVMSFEGHIFVEFEEVMVRFGGACGGYVKKLEYGCVWSSCRSQKQEMPQKVNNNAQQKCKMMAMVMVCVFVFGHFWKAE